MNGEQAGSASASETGTARQGDPRNVLIVSNRADGGAELAAALVNRTHSQRMRARAAGGFPAGGVQAEVSRVGRALGIDVTPSFPARLTVELVETADLVVALHQDDQFDGDRLPHVHRWNVPPLTDHHFDSYLELAAAIEEQIAMFAIE